MKVVDAESLKNRKVLLRMDLDVAIEDGVVVEDFRLVAGMATLELCLEHARSVIILGHLGRPDGKKVDELSVGPIYDWLIKHGFGPEFNSGKLKLLENLRFEKGEDDADIYFAKELAALGDFYVNEAFAAHHSAASTTVLPMLLPHVAGLQFAKEVETLKRVRSAQQSGLVVIIGGVKVEDKLPAVLEMAKIAEHVLVGGKIVSQLSVLGDQLSESGLSVVGQSVTDEQITDQLNSENRKQKTDNQTLPSNILVADLTEDGEDITQETVRKWELIIRGAKMILWNGPLGKVEELKNNNSEKIAQLIIESGAESIVGGGDTVSYLDAIGDLPMFSFVSTGGGAMMEFLVKGTLPTIEALK